VLVVSPAVKLGSYFVTGKRDNGEEFVSLVEGRPEWLHEAVRVAHQGDLPSDWVYAACRAACDAIDEGSITRDGDDDDGLHEFANAQVDVYTEERFKWAAHACLSSLYASAEEEAEELGAKDSSTIADRLGTIQYCALRAIAATIRDAWTAATDRGMS